MPTENAFEYVNGQLRLDDTENKASFASTLGRVQDDGDNHGAVKIDLDADTPSLMAQDYQIANNMMGAPSIDSMRERNPRQMGDNLDDSQTVPGLLDAKEEVDYNWDVAYLQKYGRA